MLTIVLLSSGMKHFLKKMELLAPLPSFSLFRFAICSCLIQDKNSISYFHFGIFFILQNSMKIVLILSLSPICLPSQTCNHFHKVYVYILPISLFVYNKYNIHYYLPLWQILIYTHLYLLKISKAHCFHFSTQKSIFEGVLFCFVL